MLRDKMYCKIESVRYPTSDEFKVTQHKVYQ